MRVKICGLTSKTNLAAILNMYPHYVGFVCYPQSPRYVSPEEMSSFPLGEHKRGGILSVGVFVNPAMADIEKYLSRGVFEVVQLHGDEKNSFVDEIKKKFPSVSIIKAFQVDQTFSFEAPARSNADLLLFDTASENFGGSGKQFPWKALANYKGTIPFMVAGGIGLDNVKQALEEFKKFPQCVGIDASSKLEISPGEKDLAKVDRFIIEVQRWKR